MRAHQAEQEVERLEEAVVQAQKANPFWHKETSPRDEVDGFSRLNSAGDGLFDHYHSSRSGCDEARMFACERVLHCFV